MLVGCREVPCCVLHEFRNLEPHGQPERTEEEEGPDVEHLVGPEDDVPLEAFRPVVPEAVVVRPLEDVGEGPEGPEVGAPDQAHRHPGRRVRPQAGNAREGRPSLDQKDDPVEHGGNVLVLGPPLQDCPGDRGRPDDPLDDGPQDRVVAPHQQPSDRRVEEGDPEKDGREIEEP